MTEKIHKREKKKEYICKYKKKKTERMKKRFILWEAPIIPRIM